MTKANGTDIESFLRQTLTMADDTLPHHGAALLIQLMQQLETLGTTIYPDHGGIVTSEHAKNRVRSFVGLAYKFEDWFKFQKRQRDNPYYEETT